MSVNYIKHETISLKAHAELNEKWVQELIAGDPKILGLGDLVLRDKERVQPRAGRLDLFSSNSSTSRFRFGPVIDLPSFTLMRSSSRRSSANFLASYSSDVPVPR